MNENEEEHENLTNVGTVERIISGLGGLTLIGLGLVRFRPALILVGGGAGLLSRGVTGQSVVYRWLGVSTARGNTNEVAVRPIRFHRTFEVDAPPGQVYAALLRPTTLETAFASVARIEALEGDSHRIHFKAGVVEWACDASVERSQDRSIAWSPEGMAAEGPQLTCRGSMVLSPTDKSATRTEVKFEAEFEVGQPWMKVVAMAMKPYLWTAKRADSRRMGLIVENAIRDATSSGAEDPAKKRKKSKPAKTPSTGTAPGFA